MAEVKIATWNVNSLPVRLAHVLTWIADNKPDILALQETKVLDANFPAEAIREIGYQAVYSGQKTYNGVAILSKIPAQDVMTDIPELDDPQRRILIATIHSIRVINLYVPNGQSVDSEKYQYKLQWLRQVTAYIKQELEKYPRLVVLGDFNIAPAPEDVHDPQAWKDQVLFSEAERHALQQLLAVGLSDSFRLFTQTEKIYSWWDYRMLAFQRNRGLRIDHILASKAMASACQSCVIDKAPRKWQRPSDHAPVVAVFDI